VKFIIKRKFKKLAYKMNETIRKNGSLEQCVREVCASTETQAITMGWER
jgi:hypothetical protein